MFLQGTAILAIYSLAFGKQVLRRGLFFERGPWLCAATCLLNVDVAKTELSWWLSCPEAAGLDVEVAGGELCLWAENVRSLGSRILN